MMLKFIKRGFFQLIVTKNPVFSFEGTENDQNDWDQKRNLGEVQQEYHFEISSTVFDWITLLDICVQYFWQS